MVATFALVLALVTQVAAAPLPRVGDTGRTAAVAAEQVARAAQQLGGDATIAAALTAVKVGADGALVPSRHSLPSASRQHWTCGCWPAVPRPKI